MKANEYVKEYGWDEAKKLIDSVKLKVVVNGVDCVPCFILGDGKYLGYDELKRLVESHELVGRYGTEDEAKEYLPMLRMDSYDELKQAIEDVESCQ